MGRDGNAGGLGPPLSSDVVVNGGLYVPKRALDRWAVGLPGLQNVAIVGDSIVQGTATPGVAPGYLDGFATRLQRALGNALGGNNGAGFFGLWRSGNTLGYLNSITEWTFAGTTPTIVLSNSPNQLVPYSGCFTVPSGAANVATFTPPPKVAAVTVVDCVTVSGSKTINSPSSNFTNSSVGKTIYGLNIPRNACIVDFNSPTQAVISLAATGSGTGQLTLMGRNICFQPFAQVMIWWVDNALAPAWSYSVDNGGTWIDVASTTPAVATLKRVAVTTTLPNGNIKVRGANAAGTGKAFILAGVELRSVAAPTSGVIVHNITKDGGTYNNIDNGGVTRGLLGSAGTADFLRLLDNGGDTTQASLQPPLTIALFSNDADLLEAATITIPQYQANVQTLISRLFPFGDLLIINPMEQVRTASSATQAAMRAATKATCIANGVAYLDIYDAWTAQGTQGFAACNTDGLMLNPVHPSLEGHADICGHIARMLATLAV